MAGTEVNNGGPTRHLVRQGDARGLAFIETESVHLVVTSPPYADLKAYPDQPGQLGNIPDYDKFLDELDRVWTECMRILVPGGRAAEAGSIFVRSAHHPVNTAARWPSR